MRWGKTQKSTNFFSSNRKKTRKADKDGNEATIIISCKSKFVDSGTFMANLLSNLVDNLTEGTKLNAEIVIVFLKVKCQ